MVENCKLSKIKKDVITDFMTFKCYDCINLLNLVKAEFKIASNLIAGLSYRLRRVSQSPGYNVAQLLKFERLYPKRP